MPSLLVWPQEALFYAAAVVDERPPLRTVLSLIQLTHTRSSAGATAGELSVDDASARVAAALGWPAAQAEL